MAVRKLVRRLSALQEGDHRQHGRHPTLYAAAGGREVIVDDAHVPADRAGQHLHGRTRSAATKPLARKSAEHHLERVVTRADELGQRW